MLLIRLMIFFSENVAVRPVWFTIMHMLSTHIRRLSLSLSLSLPLSLSCNASLLPPTQKFSPFVQHPNIWFFQLLLSPLRNLLLPAAVIPTLSPGSVRLPLYLGIEVSERLLVGKSHHQLAMKCRPAAWNGNLDSTRIRTAGGANYLLMTLLSR